MRSQRHQLKIDPPLPLWERIFRALAYLSFTGGAVWTIFGQLPKSLIEVTEPWQIIAFSIFLGLSLIASVATLRGRYYTEYAVLPLVIGAIAIYEAGMIFIVASGDGAGSGLAMFIVFGLICCLLGRYVSLHALVTAPSKLEKIKEQIEGHEKGRPV